MQDGVFLKMPPKVNCAKPSMCNMRRWTSVFQIFTQCCTVHHPWYQNTFVHCLIFGFVLKIGGCIVSEVALSELRACVHVLPMRQCLLAGHQHLAQRTSGLARRAALRSRSLMKQQHLTNLWCGNIYTLEKVNACKIDFP